MSSSDEDVKRDDLIFSDNQYSVYSKNTIYARPRYQVGDMLWVKEAHWEKGRYFCTGEKTKTGKEAVRFEDCNRIKFDEPANIAQSRFDYGWHKRSPLYMEKKHARLWLKVTGMKAERLQKISEEDAIAEGMFFTDYGKRCFHPKPCPLPDNHRHHLQLPGWSHKKTENSAECMGSARHAFLMLWNDINTKPGTCYDDNPFVIAYEFERIER